jgi:hypothetical protein
MGDTTLGWLEKASGFPDKSIRLSLATSPEKLAH